MDDDDKGIDEEVGGGYKQEDEEDEKYDEDGVVDNQKILDKIFEPAPRKHSPGHKVRDNF